MFPSRAACVCGAESDFEGLGECCTFCGGICFHRFERMVISSKQGSLFMMKCVRTAVSLLCIASLWCSAERNLLRTVVAQVKLFQKWRHRRKPRNNLLHEGSVGTARCTENLD